jgi:hypothetical protein
MNRRARRRSEQAADATAGRAITELISRSHLMWAPGVAGEIARAARPLGVSGVSGVQAYLADLQQRHLAPLATADGPPPTCC